MARKKFIKYDKDKLQYSLIDPFFIEGVTEVLTYGANKYYKDNWKKVDSVDRYVDALERHVIAYRKGETKDPESKLSHLLHAACCLMFLYYFERKKNGSIRKKV